MVVEVPQAFIEHIQQRSRRVVYSFAASSGIEAADLEQEIVLQVARKWERIRQAKVPTTYAMRVARNRLIDIYRAQNAQKRGGRRRAVSLFQPLHVGSDLALIDVLRSD
jgi:RNA polymerase sigma factor (sigma-70 family)